MNLITVENLVKKYGNHVAVDHLSFTVEQGQIYGFLGPNGAGKSTTMNIMTGYLAATEGTVEIDGHNILTDAEAAKSKIGYLPEFPPLYLDMTVWEYLRFVAELKRVPKKERAEQIETIMKMLEIDEVKERLIKNLSKGYRQRVGLAQAIIGDPAVLILDEPMVGLDPKQIIEIRELIKKLSKKHTIILSSHILSEISAICDHIMIISHGKLVASDSPQGLQKLMDQTTEIEVTALGTREKAEKILSEMADIQAYSFETAEERNAVKIKIETVDNRDIRKELSVALTGKDMPVLSMNKVERSLEDIFLQLTEASGADAGADKTASETAGGEAAGNETDTMQEQEDDKDDSDI